MHIFFSGIGGTGIGPLALIAKQAGYQVSGSDSTNSNYIDYLKKHDINNIQIGQTTKQIEEVHRKNPIDWVVYSSALTRENPDHPELNFAKKNNIKSSKRDDFINHILQDKHLKMIAVAGTHGKTTTTAMLIWLMIENKIPVSYSVGAKIGFGEMGHFVSNSEYFVYEADEFDHNFLSFKPDTSLITGIDWDHPDIYPTRKAYNQAFNKFISQTRSTLLWQTDFEKLGLISSPKYKILMTNDPSINKISLIGLVNRQDAWLVVHTLNKLFGIELADLINQINNFPGLSRRFEKLIPNLYSDYAHTPLKILGALQTANEHNPGKVVVVYEGLHNTRQHFIKKDLKQLFDSAVKLYIVPSYLAREDKKLQLLSPKDLSELIDKKINVVPSQLNQELKESIDQELSNGNLVLCLSAGGGGSLDEWLRLKFKNES